MSERDRNQVGRVSRRNFLRTAGSVTLVGPASAVVAECALARQVSARLEEEKRPPNVPEVQISQAVCGAYLRDDFNSGRIDPAIWRTWVNDPGFRVEIDRGELCLRGTSAQLPEAELRKNAALLARYVGVYSQPRAQVDVHVAVGVKMPSGIASDPGAHVVNVHLCGVEPDCYAEVLFGKLESKPLEKWAKDYNGFRCPYQDARGWWFSITNQDPGRYWWRVSGRPLPELGDERTTFHDVLVTYDEPTRLSRGFVKAGERWVQLGEPEHVILGFSRVELKLTDPTPLFGTYREARFNDFRLYPNPKRNPIRFVVRAKAAPYRGPTLRVALYTPDRAHRVSEGYTDQDGIAYLSVSSPHWLAFPVSAMVRIFQGAREIGKASIEAQGVKGLYPGDVWEFDRSEVPHSAAAFTCLAAAPTGGLNDRARTLRNN